MPERLAIIGAGAMGMNHARTAFGLHSEVELVAVVDQDLGRARSLVQEFNMGSTKPFDNLSDIDGDIADIAIIATPSSLHCLQSTELMRNGVHVLVEKPAALKDEELTEMKRVQEEEKKVLMVGHVELFNPVVNELLKVIGERAIRSMRFKRLGLVNDQSRLYHDVVRDLMLHDLSIADAVVSSDIPAQVISAFGRSDTKAFPDPAEVIIDYGNGIDGQFRASRAFTGGKVRSVEVETEDGVFDADLLTRSITQRSGREGAIAPNGTYIQDIRTSSHFANGSRQPLELELLHFISSVREQTAPCEARVSIDDARRIMKLTENILSNLVLLKKS